ncbi:MAG: FAD-binding protein [Euryarchaeota archaeon]|nr:FAD-binding protein [Euryarchaeota archaeon]
MELVKVCAEHGLKLTPRGAGTSLCGAPVPSGEHVVVDFTLMNRILEVDEDNRYVLAEPGVVYGELNRALAEYGLFFPPDPASGSACTIGGMVAMNSSGMRAVRYGTTKDYVSSLRVVLSSGEVLSLGGRYLKSSSGYDLLSLFVGSEGTLGLFTRIGLRVLPKPEHAQAVCAEFESPEQACRAVLPLLRRARMLSVVELMDASVVAATGGDAALADWQGGAVLLCESEGFSEQAVQEDASGAAEVLREQGGRLLQAEAEQVWSCRRGALPALAELAENLLLEDVTVPVSALPEMLRAVEEVSERHGARVAVFGHAGDGNLHPTFLWDGDEAPEEAIEELFRRCIALGGTLSGEHGIGTRSAGSCTWSTAGRWS